jgi:mono/diheme cytochrome c family protein
VTEVPEHLLRRAKERRSAMTGESAGDEGAAGAVVYKAQGCSGCHGPTGGGGVGPALAGVTKTFPEFADHVAWVRSGSKPFQGKPYGATGKVATGGMPGFPDLTDEEVIAVVCHERVTYGKADPLPPECEEGANADTEGEGSGENDSASGES